MTSYDLSIPTAYKRYLQDHLSFYAEMPAGKHRIPPEEGDISSEPKRVMAPQIDTCNYAEANIPAYDPNTALLRRVFLIGHDKFYFNCLLPYQKLPAGGGNRSPWQDFATPHRSTRAYYDAASARTV
jgi:hypothetical protein